MNKAVSRSITIKPEVVTPHVVAKKWGGMVTEKETPEQVAKRISSSVSDILKPTFAQAEEAKRLKEENNKLNQTVANLEQHLKPFFARLDRDDLARLNHHADKMRADKLTLVQKAQQRTVEKDKPKSKGWGR